MWHHEYPFLGEEWALWEKTWVQFLCSLDHQNIWQDMMVRASGNETYPKSVFFWKIRTAGMPSHSRCVVQGRVWQTHYLTLKSAKPGLLSHFCPCPSLPHHTICTFFAFYVCILYILSHVGENTVSGLREPGSIQHTWFSFIAPLFMVIVIVSMFCHQKLSIFRCLLYSNYCHVKETSPKKGSTLPRTNMEPGNDGFQ